MRGLSKVTSSDLRKYIRSAEKGGKRAKTQIKENRTKKKQVTGRKEAK